MSLVVITLAGLIDWPGYAVSQCGRVYRIVDGSYREVSQCLRKGYPAVALRANGKQVVRDVHTLVAAAWLGPRPHGLQVCHYDDIKTNNHVSNLSYDTRSNNTHDSYRNGRIVSRGKQIHTCLLDESIVADILRDLKNGIPQTAIAAKHDVSHDAVSDIKRGKTWKHVPRL